LGEPRRFFDRAASTYTSRSDPPFEVVVILFELLRSTTTCFNDDGPDSLTKNSQSRKGRHDRRYTDLWRTVMMTARDQEEH